MNILAGLAAAAAAGALFALGGCSTSADTHHHGPRQTMRDSGMPAAESRECPYDTASHDMHRPRDTGRMLTAAHPDCRDQATETATEEAPAEPQAQQQPQ